VHNGQQDPVAAVEFLSLWAFSGGKCLGPKAIQIEVRKSFDFVLALISLLRGIWNAA
jgi:hypothetical protein